MALPLDFAFEIKRAFPDCRAGGASPHPDDHPLLLRERIWRVQNKVAAIAEIKLGRNPCRFCLSPTIPSELLEVVPPDRVRRDFDRFHRVDVERRVWWWWQSNDALMSLSLHPSGCHSAVYVRYALIPTVRAIEERIERAVGALFAKFPSAFAMAHWLVTSHEAGVRRAIDFGSPNHRPDDPHRAGTAGALVRILAPAPRTNP
jgi:hypothetical protein